MPWRYPDLQYGPLAQLGQSIRLITGRSLVQVQDGPPYARVAELA